MRFEVVPDNNQGLLRLEVQVCQLSIQVNMPQTGS